MSPPEASLVYRSACTERYDGLSFGIFVTAPALIAAPWWLLLTLGSITWTIAALTARP